MRDLTQPLEECLRAMGEKRNLQEVLRRYPTERDHLIELLRLSVDLGGLAPSSPAADPAFRLRARNRMLVDQHHPDTRLGSRKCCGQSRGTGTDYDEGNVLRRNRCLAGDRRLVMVRSRAARHGIRGHSNAEGKAPRARGIVSPVVLFVDQALRVAHSS